MTYKTPAPAHCSLAAFRFPDGSVEFLRDSEEVRPKVGEFVGRGARLLGYIDLEFSPRAGSLSTTIYPRSPELERVSRELTQRLTEGGLDGLAAELDARSSSVVN